MNEQQFKQKILAKLPESEVILSGDSCNLVATIVSDEFNGLSLLKRQQLIYSIVGENITSGELHALSLKTFTNSEWQARNK